jgi:hypothetical protein
MIRSGSGGSNAQCKLRGHCTVLRLPAMSSVSSARFQWAVGRVLQAVAPLKGCSPSTQHMPYTLACSCRWKPRGREAPAQAREGALLQLVSCWSDLEAVRFVKTSSLAPNMGACRSGRSSSCAKLIVAYQITGIAPTRHHCVHVRRRTCLLCVRVFTRSCVSAAGRQALKGQSCYSPCCFVFVVLQDCHGQACTRMAQLLCKRVDARVSGAGVLCNHFSIRHQPTSTLMSGSGRAMFRSHVTCCTVQLVQLQLKFKLNHMAHVW